MSLLTAGVEQELEGYRVELTGYCYRMLGSGFEAEDAVQETMVRAWKNYEKFEGRSAVRSWLYRIATNVCLDMLGSAQRRARPMELGPAATSPSSIGATSPEIVPMAENVWVGPVPDSRVLPETSDPADLAISRETVKLAFVAALQHLPAKQRAVLILREVLAWSAQEVADLLDTSVASVNSALQRARGTIAEVKITPSEPVAPLDKEQLALLTRYVAAFESYDMEALASLLHEDAVLSMPPLALWFQGIANIREWMLGTGSGCRDSKLVPTIANGLPAFGQYRTTGPWALIVLEISGGRIVGVNNFLDVERVFPLFGLPMTYDAGEAGQA